MDKFIGLTLTSTLFLLFFFTELTLNSAQTLSNDVVADNAGQNNVENNKDEKPSTLVMLTDTLGLLSRSQISTWNKVKAFLNQLQLHFSPPNLDFRSRDIAHSRMGDADGAGGRMKEAAEKSFGTSKAAVEESAKSAAKVVGGAVQKTAEKVKETVSSNDENEESAAEL